MKVISSTIGATNPIWGIRTPWAPSTTLTGSSTQRVAPIERQLNTFLRKQIRDWDPDQIIVIERKGTAILRALKESTENPLDWQWSKVISSAVVDQMDDEYFRDKRILVFDDMMKTGHHLRDFLSAFHSRGLWTPNSESLRIAVFAVHGECSAGIPFQDTHVLHSWFYRDLTSSAYQNIRNQIVGMLQKAGSLMLDTEHIEIRVKLTGSFARFVAALGRKANVLTFHSSAQRSNVTVLYGNDRAHSIPTERFPDGTRFVDIVKKCRVVHRKRDEFALIPLCFPAIPEGAVDWPSDPEVLALFGDSIRKNDFSRYYGAGLLGALEVLRWVLKDLAVLGSDSYTLSLPKNPDDVQSTTGYDLEHLRVMYPTLDLHRLNQWIASTEFEARSAGNQVRARKSSEATLPPMVDDEVLYKDARQLLQAIRHVLDQRIIERRWGVEPVECPHPFGLRTSEILALGRTKFHWNDIRVSALFDILIDEAFVEPHVETKLTNDEQLEMCRTFEPDGEVVSELIRRYTSEWGLPHGF